MLKKNLISTVITIFMSMVSINAFSYDIAVENADGVTIYYNYYNEGRELEVTAVPEWKYPKYTDSIVIPEEVTYSGRTRKVTSIGKQAFYYCNITSITIPKSVTSIGVGNFGEGTFYGCQKLTSIMIPSSVTTIGRDAFANCTGLTSVQIEDIGSWCNISFYNDESNPLSKARHLFLDNMEITELVVPDGVKSIGNYAFLNGAGFKSIIIPNSVESIGTCAFQNCIGLTSVNIPNSVTDIGDSAFDGCSSLTSVSIPNSVMFIGAEAFYNCNALSELTISNNVTSIGERAFYNCYKLQSVTLPSSLENIGSNAFYGSNLETVFSYIKNPFIIKGRNDTYPTFSKNTFYNSTLYVPEGTIEKYKTTAGWKDFVFIEEMAGGGEEPIVEQCAVPTIHFANGKLSFECETEGVEFVSEITDADIKKYYSSEIDLSATYNITVYAQKTDYEDSEITTATLCWIEAEPQTEGITDDAVLVKEVKATPVLIQSFGSQLSIEGAPTGAGIAIFDLNGRLIGQTKVAATGTTKVAVPSGEKMLIVKVGEKSVKVVR